jgi:hypothetical protein
LRVNKLSNRHLAFGLVVDGPGTPQSLHLPIATLDSRRSVFRDGTQCQIDFPQQRVFHNDHLLRAAALRVCTGTYISGGRSKEKPEWGTA